MTPCQRGAVMSNSLIAMLTRMVEKKEQLRQHRLSEPSLIGAKDWCAWYDRYRVLASDLSILKEEFLKLSVKEVFS